MLTSHLSALEKELATAADRIGAARASRDEAGREVLRRAPLPFIDAVGTPAAMVLGLLSGLGLVIWWLGLPMAVAWPRLAPALALGASTVVLLRGAWRAGRISGARGAS